MILPCSIKELYDKKLFATWFVKWQSVLNCEQSSFSLSMLMWKANVKKIHSFTIPPCPVLPTWPDIHMNMHTCSSCLLCLPVAEFALTLPVWVESFPWPLKYSDFNSIQYNIVDIELDTVEIRFVSFFFFSAFSVRVAGCCRFFIPLRGCGAYWGQIQLYSWAKARVHPEWVASSLQDPYWWQWLPHKVPTAHQEQFWGSVSCSRILRHVAQSHPRGAGIRTSDLPITGPPALLSHLMATASHL